MSPLTLSFKKTVMLQDVVNVILLLFFIMSLKKRKNKEKEEEVWFITMRVHESAGESRWERVGGDDRLAQRWWQRSTVRGNILI